MYNSYLENQFLNHDVSKVFNNYHDYLKFCSVNWIDAFNLDKALSWYRVHHSNSKESTALSLSNALSVQLSITEQDNIDNWIEGVDYE